MKAVQLYNICWNNILQNLFCKLFAFGAKSHPIGIRPPLFEGCLRPCELQITDNNTT